jgi:hypothetical protein
MITMKRRALALLLPVGGPTSWALLLLFAACSSEPGEPALVDARTVELRSLAGGGEPGPVVGAPCDAGTWTYNLGLSDGTLSWNLCHRQGPFEDPASYSRRTGSRPLTAIERDQTRAAVAALVPSHRTECGADKGTWELEVHDAAGHAVVYGDDFYACHKRYQRYFTSESLEQLLAVVSPMAH